MKSDQESGRRKPQLGLCDLMGVCPVLKILTFHIPLENWMRLRRTSKYFKQQIDSFALLYISFFDLRPFQNPPNVTGCGTFSDKPGNYSGWDNSLTENLLQLCNSRDLNSDGRIRRIQRVLDAVAAAAPNLKFIQGQIPHRLLTKLTKFHGLQSLDAGSEFTTIRPPVEFYQSVYSIIEQCKHIRCFRGPMRKELAEKLKWRGITELVVTGLETPETWQATEFLWRRSTLPNQDEEDIYRRIGEIHSLKVLEIHVYCPVSIFDSLLSLKRLQRLQLYVLENQDIEDPWLGFLNNVPDLSLHSNKEIYKTAQFMSSIRTTSDTNAGGTVEWGDFYLVTKKIKIIYGAESEQMTMAHSSLKALWNGLLSLADHNQDKVISVAEWVELLDGHDPTNEAKWFHEYMTFVFKLFDVSADLHLDIAEYVDGMAAYGFVEGDAHAAFKKFALDDKGNPTQTVDFPAFKKLWYQYFYSKDPAAPGNHLFGVMA